jgi:hypothetical protein
VIIYDTVKATEASVYGFGGDCVAGVGGDVVDAVVLCVVGIGPVDCG